MNWELISRRRSSEDVVGHFGKDFDDFGIELTSSPGLDFVRASARDRADDRGGRKMIASRVSATEKMRAPIGIFAGL